MTLIRFVLGKVILFFDFIFSPKALVRSRELQAQVDLDSKNLTLYQLLACPFCVKVRRQMKRLAISTEIKDIKRDPKAHAELMAGGKLDQVPCLQIRNANGSIQYLYESDAINEYLVSRFQGSD